MANELTKDELLMVLSQMIAPLQSNDPRQRAIIRRTIKRITERAGEGAHLIPELLKIAEHDLF